MLRRAASPDQRGPVGGVTGGGGGTLCRSPSGWLLLLEDVDRRASEGVAPRARRSEYLRHLWEELAEPGISVVPVASLVDSLAEVGVALDDPRLAELRRCGWSPGPLSCTHLLPSRPPSLEPLLLERHNSGSGGSWA